MEKFKQFIGLEASGASYIDRLVATIGGVLGIAITYFISFHSTDAQGAAAIVPSMGASAVLLFAVPHGALSQPWQLIGGHLVSAIVGVSCYLLVPDIFLAAGLAVGLSIGVMHVLRCIHPPGGATALAAVIGGPAIHNLGYGYVIYPIAINVLAIFIIAIAFNSLFSWRRYPVALMHFEEKNQLNMPSQRSPVKCKHIGKAIKDMDLVLDVTEKELEQLYLLALHHSEDDHLNVEEIKLKHYYSNGKFGKTWSIRQVIDMSEDANQVIYRVAEGAHKGYSNNCSREEFARWAVEDVTRVE